MQRGVGTAEAGLVTSVDHVTQRQHRHAKAHSCTVNCHYDRLRKRDQRVHKITAIDTHKIIITNKHQVFFYRLDALPVTQTNSVKASDGVLEDMSLASRILEDNFYSPWPWPCGLCPWPCG